MITQYHVYRFFITPISNQTSIIISELTKEEKFKRIISELNTNEKTTFKYLKKKSIIYSVNSFNDILFFFNFAKETERTKHVEGEKSVEDIKDSELKSVWFILDLERQFILIEKNTSEFQNTDLVKNALKYYLNSKSKEWDYNINIREITKSDNFWKFINDVDNIETIKLTFNAPNMIYGNSDIKEALKKLKEDSNFEEVETKVTSTERDLKIEGHFEKQVNYILNVGGEYFVRAYKEGKKKILNSKTNIMSLEFPKELTTKGLEKIITSLKSIQNKLDKNEKKE